MGKQPTHSWLHLARSFKSCLVPRAWAFLQGKKQLQICWDLTSGWTIWGRKDHYSDTL